jgi:hypothetical protein
MVRGTVGSEMADPPVLDDKMRALLMKMRKGADASVSVPQLMKVLTMLGGGWRVEEIVGLTPLHYEKGDAGSKHEIKYGLWREDESGASEIYDKLRAMQVERLPSHPKLGQFFVAGLEPFSLRDEGYRKAYGAKYKLWAATPGYRVTDPAGHVFELLPSRHDINHSGSTQSQERGLPVIDAKELKRRLRTSGIFPWLKKSTSYLDDLNALLGTAPHEKATPRTRENTGTCGACFGNFKLEHTRGELPLTVLHGYRRPGSGHTVGRCPGEDHPPYELSPEATKKELGGLKEQHASTLGYLKRLRGGEVSEFVFFGSPPVRKSEVPAVVWEHEVKNHERRLKGDLERLEATILVYGWLVKNWEKRPLPQVGEREFNWLEHAGMQLRKQARS